MTEPSATPPTEDPPPGEEGELQFDQAEFATPAAERPTCTVCHQPLPDEYYEINQRLLCPRCRDGVEAAFRRGSPAARFLKATAMGLVASIVGAALYYAFVRATQWNLGLIAILLGFMVGTAVRRGTGNRGGRVYQFLALFLAYSSIVAMNVPLLIEALIKNPPEKPAARVAAEKKEGGAKPDPPEAGVDAGKAAQAEEAPRRPNPLRLLVLIVGFIYAFPILESMEAPITGLIYAFALWEAWKINKRVHLVFNGPFRLAAAGAPGVGPEEVDHES